MASSFLNNLSSTYRQSPSLRNQFATEQDYLDLFDNQKTTPAMAKAFNIDDYDTTGVKSIIKSPTFSLVNEYKCNSLNNVYHFDFYRIKNQNDLINIDINYYLYSNSYCFIE